MWRWFWRLIGLAALILPALCCFFLYTLWKASDIQAVAAGKPVGNSLDVISLQIDILSITMAAVGIGLGVVGLIGYQSRSEEHTSELQSLMRISYAVFCLKKKTNVTQEQ